MLGPDLKPPVSATPNDEPSSFKDEKSKVLNLDITAMVAYVSALTNGEAQFNFQENILSDQAARERSNPAKPFLDNLFEGRKLICCKSAADDFMAITNTLAGPGEKCRVSRLISKYAHEH